LLFKYINISVLTCVHPLKALSTPLRNEIAIARLAHENVVYMYLTGNEKPDFRTICNFKRECKELIEEAFKKAVTVARSLARR